MDTRSFEREVIERSRERPVVVVFGSGSLPLLQPFTAMIEQEVRERSGGIGFAFVDVDRDPQLAARRRIQMVPTVRAFRQGQPVGGFVGVRPREAVASFLDSLLGPTALEQLVDELRAEREWPDVVAAIDEAAYEHALDLLLRRAEQADGPRRERIRRLMVALFAELGEEHPVSAHYRRRLAALLY